MVLLQRELISKSNIASNQGLLAQHAQAKDRFGHLASYEPCVAVHAVFHQEAGKVAQRVNFGGLPAANQMLFWGPAYAKASVELANSVAAIHVQRGRR